MSKQFIPIPTEDQRDAFDSRFMRGVDRVAGWFQRHWLACFNGATLTLVLGGFLAPFAQTQGWNGLAAGLWLFYRRTGICVSDHSYYLWGHQMCLCERCTAIYTAMFLAGLGFAAMRRFLPALSLKLFLLMILPMVLDGFTQLFGLRQSDWLLRTITGALFGFACVWFIYPRFSKANDEELYQRSIMKAA